MIEKSKFIGKPIENYPILSNRFLSFFHFFAKLTSQMTKEIQMGIDKQRTKREKSTTNNKITKRISFIFIFFFSFFPNRNIKVLTGKKNVYLD